MNKEKIKIRDEFIKLSSFLKFVGAAHSGAAAKEEILNGKVLVNDEVCTQKGKKLRAKDTITFADKIYEIE